MKSAPSPSAVGTSARGCVRLDGPRENQPQEEARGPPGPHHHLTLTTPPRPLKHPPPLPLHPPTCGGGEGGGLSHVTTGALGVVATLGLKESHPQKTLGSGASANTRKPSSGNPRSSTRRGGGRSMRPTPGRLQPNQWLQAWGRGGEARAGACPSTQRPRRSRSLCTSPTVRPRAEPFRKGIKASVSVWGGGRVSHATDQRPADGGFPSTIVGYPVDEPATAGWSLDPCPPPIWLCTTLSD